MKLLKIVEIATLMTAIQAACEEDGDHICPNEGDVCMRRYTHDVANPFDSDYLNLLQADPSYAKNSKKYTCESQEVAEIHLESDKLKDRNSTVIFMYDRL